MSIAVTCNCGARLKVRAEAAGKRLTCPKCGGPFEVVGPAASPEGRPSEALSTFDIVEDFREEPPPPPVKLTTRRPVAPAGRGVPAAAKWAGGLFVSLALTVAVEVARESLRGPEGSAPRPRRLAAESPAPDPWDRPPGRAAYFEHSPPEQKLAILEAKEFMRPDDPRIERFRKLLSRANRIYRENDLVVASATITAGGLLEKEGRESSLYDMLSAMVEEVPIPKSGLPERKFGDWLTAYLTFRRDKPHRDSVVMLREFAKLRWMVDGEPDGNVDPNLEPDDDPPPVAAGVQRPDRVAPLDPREQERRRIAEVQRQRADAEAAEQVRLAELERKQREVAEEAARIEQEKIDAGRKATVLLAAADRKEQRGETRDAIVAYRELVALFPAAPQAEHARYRVRELDPSARNDPAFGAKPVRKLTAAEKRRELDHQLAERQKEKAAKAAGLRLANDQAAALAPAAGAMSRDAIRASDAYAAEQARKSEAARRGVFVGP